MLLSDRDILREMKEGTVTIEPFNEEQLQPCGYDVRVSSVYYVMKEESPVFFPFTEEFVEKMYERREAEESTVRVRNHKARGKFIVIPPHGFVLAATIERTRTVKNITASLRCRSSLARAGMSIARSAGWGDIGYDGVWTMDIINHLNVPYYLPVGLRVGQLVFLKTETPTGKEYSGKYSGSTEPAVPKLYKDRDLATLVEIEKN